MLICSRSACPKNHSISKLVGQNANVRVNENPDINDVELF